MKNEIGIKYREIGKEKRMKVCPICKKVVEFIHYCENCNKCLECCDCGYNIEGIYW